jgi:hypothetical protein
MKTVIAIHPSCGGIVAKYFNRKSSDLVAKLHAAGLTNLRIQLRAGPADQFILNLTITMRVPGYHRLGWQRMFDREELTHARFSVDMAALILHDLADYKRANPPTEFVSNSPTRA